MRPSGAVPPRREWIRTHRTASTCNACRALRRLPQMGRLARSATAQFDDMLRPGKLDDGAGLCRQQRVLGARDVIFCCYADLIEQLGAVAVIKILRRQGT